MNDFPGGPEVKTPHFPCKEAGFNLLIKDLRSHVMCGVAKKKKKNKKSECYLSILFHERIISTLSKRCES